MNNYQTHSLKISPVTGALGAIVEGINLVAASDVELGCLKAALDQHLVLYVPDQDLSRHELSRLGRYFGPPFLHPIVNNGFDDCPEVLELLRKAEDTNMFGRNCWIPWRRCIPISGTNGARARAIP